jgi:hypothetical protein
MHRIWIIHVVLAVKLAETWSGWSRLVRLVVALLGHLLHNLLQFCKLLLM